MRTQLIGMISLVRKETSRVLRIWVQTLIPPGITMSLYFIIFGTLIGKRIGEKVRFIVNNDPFTGIDIHTKQDLYLAEMAMRYVKKHKLLDH